MIKEHDRVVLRTGIRKEGIEPGDVGTVVQVYDDGKAYEVEITMRDGHTAAVVTIDPDAVRPVSRSDITHTRALHPG